MGPPLILPPGEALARELFFVLPGLNLHPSRLSPWHGLLAEGGSAVLAPALTGFGFPGDPAQQKVSAAGWITDLNAARMEAGGRLPGAACSLLGYSLGGLLGLTWAIQHRIPLERALLISPALRLRPWVRISIATLGRFLPRRLNLPSLAPADFRLHPSTTVAAFWAVVELERQFSSTLEGWLAGGLAGSGGREPPPRLLIAFTDKDEFVDTRVFHRLRNAYPERVSLHRMNHARKPGYPLHLGLDADTLGEGEWNRLKGVVTKWLAATSAGERKGGRSEMEAPPPAPPAPSKRKTP